MSFLYLKLAALGVAGITVATVVPISVLKSSGDTSKVEQKSGLGAEVHTGDTGITDQEATRLDGQAGNYREEGVEISENFGSPTSSELPKANEQMTSVTKSPQIKDCKEVAKSREGRLNMCYDKEDNSKFTFKFDEFFSSSSGSETVNVTHEVGNSFSYFLSSNTLKIEVLGIDNFGRGSKSVEFDLPQEIFTDRSSFTFSGRSFNKDQCVVNWTTDSSTNAKTDWKVKC